MGGPPHYREQIGALQDLANPAPFGLGQVSFQVRGRWPEQSNRETPSLKEYKCLIQPEGKVSQDFTSLINTGTNNQFCLSHYTILLPCGWNKTTEISSGNAELPLGLPRVHEVLSFYPSLCLCGASRATSRYPFRWGRRCE